jgi:3-methyl-2-oxobutanoate hydroxymethyltransferase
MQTRVSTLAQWKQEGHKWAMLTAYDYSTARAFAEAEIPVLLVGDSAANVVYGYDTTTQVSLDEMIFLTRSVVRGAPQALVVADLPFGTYEASDEQAIMTSSRVMRESGAQMVKLEGGVRMADRIRALVKAGIPVMAHIGFTPQSVHKLGGFKVQGRGDSAQQLIEDALAVQEAGASAVVLEMVPRDLAKEVTEKLDIPTVGIGAGPDTDAQVLVWYDAMAVPQDGRRPRFVKVFAEGGEAMTEAARTYRQEVEAGQFPSDEHCF